MTQWTLSNNARLTLIAWFGQCISSQVLPSMTSGIKVIVSLKTNKKNRGFISKLMSELTHNFRRAVCCS